MKKIKSKVINIKNGKNFKVIDPVNIYNAKFGNNVFVGPFTEIQCGVVIGNNCKIRKCKGDYEIFFSEKT